MTTNIFTAKQYERILDWFNSYANDDTTIATDKMDAEIMAILHMNSEPEGDKPNE